MKSKTKKQKKQSESNDSIKRRVTKALLTGKKTTFKAKWAGQDIRIFL